MWNIPEVQRVDTTVKPVRDLIFATNINFRYIHSLEQSLFWSHLYRFLGYSQEEIPPKVKLQSSRKG